MLLLLLLPFAPLEKEGLQFCFLDLPFLEVIFYKRLSEIIPILHAFGIFTYEEEK